MPAAVRRPRGNAWRIGLVVLAAASAVLTVWGIWAGSRSDYYAAIALSMSQSWSNFFFGSFDPAGTVTLDKIPGSYWIPALFVRLFGFSTWSVILPNALAAVGATLLVAVTAKRLFAPTAGLIAGAVVATTPILVAVARSNQPQTFFVLGLALTAWAAAKALQHSSFAWLIVSGLFIAMSFQAYMIEAWAVWPALAAGWLCTHGRMLRKLWQLAVAGIISLAASLPWIVIVALIPADSRPYVGSTLSNSPWEMVFGYNALGRFGQSTADDTVYRSFTPPFSGTAGAVRLFNEQVAGQIAWLIPTALLAVIVLFVLRFRLAVTVFLGVWLATFLVMFSAVAGMHQFYTSSLAIPMALAIGLAVAAARAKKMLWPQLALVAVAVVAAVAIASVYGGWSLVVAVVQALIGIAAAVLLVAEHRRGSARSGIALLVVAAMAVSLLLTPAAWAVSTIMNPSSTNPVAGGVSDIGGFGGGAGPAGFAGRNGAQGAPGRFGGQGAPQALQGGTGGSAPGAAGGPGVQGGAAPTRGQGGGGLSSETLTYLEQNRGDALYLVATFGAQSAAGIIIESGGQSVLPIGGFNGADPVPTRAQFQQLVTDGAVRYVLASGGGIRGGAGGTTTSQIQSWVQESCTAVTDAAASGLYDCAAR